MGLLYLFCFYSIFLAKITLGVTNIDKMLTNTIKAEIGFKALFKWLILEKKGTLNKLGASK